MHSDRRDAALGGLRFGQGQRAPGKARTSRPGIQGKGIRGCMPHHAPGDPVSYLEMLAREDAQGDEIKQRMKIVRARFKQPPAA